MAEQTLPAQPAAGSGATPKPPAQNPALRMLGLPNLPRKLPSRNWMIFWAISGSFAAAIIYDKREKNRATAKWRRAVAPLAQERISDASQLPRKLTVYLEAPPGDGLRVTQDHFIEYVKPVLAASGLDWEFVQGRQQGDVRAVVAEKVRRNRAAHEQPDKEMTSTDESILEDLRKKSNLPSYTGTKGDIVVGRHAWKEYIRGLHEGWLGPLDAPPEPIPEVKPVEAEAGAGAEAGPEKNEAKADKPEEESDKPKRPPQPRPYNTIDDYATASLPSQTPLEIAPASIIPFPHRLGVSHTFVRLGWFLNRRKLADNIGREVAAACFAASREWREEDGDLEQKGVLQHEEKDWPKSVFKEEPDLPKEKIWASSMVIDPRIAQSMRRFEVTPEDEARAAGIVVPEEEVEGWIKGSLRGLWRWGAKSFEDKHPAPNVGNLDEQ